MPKLVYLDSNDFSDLSAPYETLGSENKLILDALREHKAAGSACFFVSVIHLSEAVHAAAIHKEAAARRAALMRELCDNNVLLHPQELCEREVSKHAATSAGGTLSNNELLSRDGEWFGFKHDPTGAQRAIDDARAELAATLGKLSRAERRKRHLSLDFDKPRTKRAIRELLLDGSPTSQPPFPLSLIDQNLFIDCFLGEKDAQALSSAAINLMRDPHALVQHILDQTGHREQMYNIVRDQGRAWTLALDKVINQFSLLFKSAVELNQNLKTRDLVFDAFSNADLDRKMITNFIDCEESSFDDTAISGILLSCPSMAAYCDIMKSYIFSILDANYSSIKTGKDQPRRGQVSDFGDFMHSVYTPYFDVFRCDTKFGGILKSINRLRPKVAAKRAHLLEMLETP